MLIKINVTLYFKYFSIAVRKTHKKLYIKFPIILNRKQTYFYQNRYKTKAQKYFKCLKIIPTNKYIYKIISCLVNLIKIFLKNLKS